TNPTGPRIADLRLTWPNNECQRLSVTILLTYPNFGGFRQWFECPGCQRRVGKLYSPDPASDFRCRRCHKLVYRSQYEWLWRHGRYDVKKFIEREYNKLLEEAIRNDPAIRLCDELLRNQ